MIDEIIYILRKLKKIKFTTTIFSIFMLISQEK